MLKYEGVDGIPYHNHELILQEEIALEWWILFVYANKKFEYKLRDQQIIRCNLFLSLSTNWKHEHLKSSI